MNDYDVIRDMVIPVCPRCGDIAIDFSMSESIAAEVRRRICESCAVLEDAEDVVFDRPMPERNWHYSRGRHYIVRDYEVVGVQDDGVTFIQPRGADRFVDYDD